MAFHTSTALEKGTVGIIIASLCFVWVIVVIRVAIRKHINGFGADDVLMCSGLALFSMICISALLAVFYNGGRPLSEVPKHDEERSSMWFWITRLLYSVTIAPIRCSICATLLRITKVNKYRYTLFAIIAGTILISTMYLIACLCFCRPIAANWSPSAGHCTNISASIDIVLFVSASSIVADCLCAALPAFILWDLQVKTRIKVAIIVSLALGVLASAVCVVRLVFLAILPSSEKVVDFRLELAIVGILEPALGIIGGSMAALRPLLKYFQKRCNHGYSVESTSAPRHNYQLSDMLPRSKHRSVIIEGLAGSPYPPGRVSQTESEEPVLKDSTAAMHRE